jgi:F-type H+-transporting ATPase subunit epsilon
MLTIEIITPKEKILTQEVDEVILPTESGEISIFKGHIPMITHIKSGALTMLNKSDRANQNRFVLKGGYAQLKGDKLSVLTDEALAFESLDISAIDSQIAGVESKLLEIDNPGADHPLKKELHYYNMQRSFANRA